MWTIFKVFIEFVTILLLFYVLVFWLQGMCDLNSLTRDWTCTHPLYSKQSLNHGTTRGIPDFFVLFVCIDASILHGLSCLEFIASEASFLRSNGRTVFYNRQHPVGVGYVDIRKDEGWTSGTERSEC